MRSIPEFSYQYYLEFQQYFFAHAVYLLLFNSILGLNFFLLFLGMVMYDNEFETKENKI